MQPAGNWPIKDRPIKKALANVLHSTSAFAPQVPRSAAGEPTTYGLIPHICGTALTGFPQLIRQSGFEATTLRLLSPEAIPQNFGFFAL